MKHLTKYNAARQALALATKVDEVKTIHDQALAMEVYAFQSKDGELIGYATEIKMRALRRLGEMMRDFKKKGQIAKGGAPYHKKNQGKNYPGTAKIKALFENKIDKNVAKVARSFAEKTEKEWQAHIDRSIELAQAGATGDTAVLKKARAERQVEKKKKRTVRNAKLAADIKSLPDKKYGVIYADPGWQYETYNDDTGSDRAASNHYMVETVEEIGKWPVGDIAADDCVLYLWGTVPMLPEALAVMAQWGFHYKSNFCWDKEIAGTGHWNRNVHEHLLIGTRGKAVAPAPGEQYESIFEERRRGHSVKPEKAVEVIEAYHAGIPKIELNRRGKPRKGWDGWGNEAEVELAPASDPASAPTPEPAPADPEEVARAVEKLFNSTFGEPEAAE